MKNYRYDADFIAQKLPQKYPFLLVDRVVEYQAGKKILCLKNVTQNEEYFMGHFPGRKIMPGVLITEALAQTCALLGILDREQKVGAPTAKSSSPPEIGFLASMNIKFVELVFPGDQLYLQARCLRVFEGLSAFGVEAMVNNYTVCKGVIKTTLRGSGGKEK